MAKDTSGGSMLAENVQITSGLQAFRSIARGQHELVDSPFGRPAASAAPPAQVVEVIKPASLKPRRVKKPLPEASISSRSEERVGDHADLSANEENVTVPLSEALRDRAEELARVIKRNRSVRKSRITRNSIIRVALQCFLDDFALVSTLPANSEEELLEAARSRMKP